ncbi:MAG TPA: hypothetical protein VHW67_02340 [Solirubrobacteraceae bacterium]|jgi:hypothetical protein|nr:hypothetical protein [Solirubrobacteraceae bacterium]
MSSFFKSLKADLLDRRLTPVLALLGLALVAALVYAAMGGGSGSSTAPSASAPAPAPTSSGVAVSAVSTDATTASAAETTSGSARQTRGSSRNPFAPLPGVKSASKSATSEAAAAPGSSAGATTGSETTTSSGSESGSGSSESGSSQSGGSKAEEKSSNKTKPKKSYAVSVLFGSAAPGTPLLSAELKTYEDLKLQQPLPSATQPLIVYRGAIAGGKSVAFTLVGEAILRGDAVCKPDASQCQAIDLQPGQTEELEYVPLGGTAITYQLHVVSITPVKAKEARKSHLDQESAAGLKFLRKAGLVALPGLRYSRDKSVLVFAGSGRGFAPRAHASAWATAFRG